MGFWLINQRAWTVTSFVLCPLCPFMCLPVSRLFWVSSLAYPNLLGTKAMLLLLLYGILTYYWLNLNRLHTCPPIDKLKEDKGVAQARAPPPSRGMASDTLRACSDVTCTSTSRVVRWCGMVYHLGWLRKRKAYMHYWRGATYESVTWHGERVMHCVCIEHESLR
jgi:hypothetical protein